MSKITVRKLIDDLKLKEIRQKKHISQKKS